MNKTLQMTFKIIALLGFIGVLLSIGMDLDRRVLMICCTVAAVGSFIALRQTKRK
ncbi:MAG: hypothetical protein ACOX4I_05435 [Anaerovoracaceae bacterium]|jgi:hypothetical protein